MIYPYLLFRLKQIRRFLLQTGIGYIAIIFILLAGIFLQGVSNLLLLSRPILIALYGGLLLLVFTRRKDTDFLIGTELSLFFVYWVDALLIGSPLILVLLIFGKWQVVLWILALSIFFSFCWKQFKSNTTLGSGWYRLSNIDFPFLSPTDFEFKLLLRNHLIPLSLVYMICLLFAVHPASFLVLAFISLTSLQSTLEYYEPKEMIFSAVSPTKFLLQKILRLILLINLLLLPFYIIGLVFSMQSWYLYLLGFVAISLMLAFSVCNKYVFFRPGIPRISTNIIASIMLIFMLVPGFQLVVLIMSIVQYVKAKRNLKYYW